MSELKGTKTSELKLKGSIHAVKEGIDGGYYLPTLDQNTLVFQPSKDDMPAAASANLEEIMTSSDKFIEVQETAAEAKSIAEGAKRGFVFDTEAELDAWLLDEDNIGLLHLGDNLYIRDTNVPDYWWDGTSKQPLEAKTDLTDYIKNTDYATADKVGVIKVTNGSYGVSIVNNDTLRISPANENEITLKTHKYKPIVPDKIDLATKVGITTNTIELTDEEKQSARNWLGSMGKNDIMVSTGDSGITFMNANTDKRLRIAGANKALIDAKAHIYRPITPSVLDYAVKKAITESTETLTTEEQAAAQSWLGVTDNLSNYVQFTDIADDNNAGLVKVSVNDTLGTGVSIGEFTDGEGAIHTNLLTIMPANRGDIAAKNDAYIRPLTPGNIDYIILKGLTENNETWQDYEKKAARELIGAVGASEYPTYDSETNLVTPGVISTRPDDGWGLGIETIADGWQQGYLRIKPANNGEIVGKSAQYRPITPYTIDYAVLKALTDCKNTTWIDTDKEAARTLLGIPEYLLANAVPKNAAITTESYYEEAYIELEASSLYIFIHNSGSNNIEIKLQNDSSYESVIDASQETMPSFQAGAILIPKGVNDPIGTKLDESGNLINDYDDKTALLMGVTGKSLIGVPELAMKQFFYDATNFDDPYNPRINHGTIYAHNTTGSLTVWKVKL